MKRNKILGHTFAFLSVLFWSSLYVSTKILLESFNPLELLVLQFCMGYILLLIIKPKRLKLNNKKEEIYFARFKCKRYNRRSSIIHGNIFVYIEN